jgi:hypothetical protein
MPERRDWDRRAMAREAGMEHAVIVTTIKSVATTAKVKHPSH